MLLAGLGIGALASQLGAVTVSSVSDEQSAEVGGLQNTMTNLGASIGTALAGAVLISALTSSFFTGIADNPDGPAGSRERAGPADERRAVRVRQGSPRRSRRRERAARNRRCHRRRERRRPHQCIARRAGRPRRAHRHRDLRDAPAPDRACNRKRNHNSHRLLKSPIRRTGSAVFGVPMTYAERGSPKMHPYHLEVLAAERQRHLRAEADRHHVARHTAHRRDDRPPPPSADVDRARRVEGIRAPVEPQSARRIHGARTKA